MSRRHKDKAVFPTAILHKPELDRAVVEILAEESHQYGILQNKGGITTSYQTVLR